MEDFHIAYVVPLSSQPSLSGPAITETEPRVLLKRTASGAVQQSMPRNILRASNSTLWNPDIRPFVAYFNDAEWRRLLPNQQWRPLQ